MVLRAEHLVKKYKTRTVVNDVSVKVKQGEIVGLLGPNGAGKTTSFYMMVGLIRPDAGKVFIDGRDLTLVPMFRQERAWLEVFVDELGVLQVRKTRAYALSGCGRRRLDIARAVVWKA